MNKKNYPKSYNEISDILEKIWLCLENGCHDRKSPYHTFAIATIANDRPSNRTVVLRDYNKKEKSISFNTNYASTKIADIKKNSYVEGLFYDKEDKVQIRISGIARIDNMNDACISKWSQMSSQSKECYFQNIDPGMEVEKPDSVKTIYEADLSDKFTVITIKINNIDWLYLSSKGHRRAKFSTSNNFKGCWVAP